MRQHACPYPHCPFTGSPEEVDAHRAEAHDDDPRTGETGSTPPRMTRDWPPLAT
jgi:hypothetical protein